MRISETRASAAFQKHHIINLQHSNQHVNCVLILYVRHVIAAGIFKYPDSTFGTRLGVPNDPRQRQVTLSTIPIITTSSTAARC